MTPSSSSIPPTIASRRRPTRTVHVGDVPLGSDHPIVVQSMTTTSTRDVRSTVDQIERLVDAGCEIVRLTVPTSADAASVPGIRSELHRRRVRVPLVADIHFTPAAAMKAVEHVEKIRINPGNFADKKQFAVREYTDDDYRRELARAEERFVPLVRRAAELGVSMRIGTNHGSLSDRIVNRYGDTPRGMVESALEFVRICERQGYRELVLSMKASNPVVVLQAYRLLVARMDAEGMHYPIHLGVTEAGDGEDGRIKSATGIGPLLDEGIGDTVRVSLTEDPVREVPVARALVEPYNRRPDPADTPWAEGVSSSVLLDDDRYGYERRETREVAVGPHRVGGMNVHAVEVPLACDLDDEETIRREIDAQAGPRVPEEARAEVVSVTYGDRTSRDGLARLCGSLDRVAPRVALSLEVGLERLAEDAECLDACAALAHRVHVRVERTRDLGGNAGRALDRLFRLAAASGLCVLAEVGDGRGRVGSAAEAGAAVVDLARRASAETSLLLAVTPARGLSPLFETRRLCARLETLGAPVPLVLLDRPSARGVDPLLGASAALGGLLCEGVGDAVQIRAGSAAQSRRLAFGILQSARVRMTRTEFISCPSCGRTLFDLETTTARIKARTAHLKNVKIAIMGCVVNGPGEMADADFGYVGWGEDKIALFVGKEMVARDIPAGEADQRLVDLIKEHGRWTEPPAEAG